MANQIPNSLTAIAWRIWYRARFFADFGAIARLLRYRRLRDRYYREFWERAATALGASLAPTQFGLLRISRNGISTFVRQSLVMLDDHLTLEVMGNKALTYSLLGEMGYPVIGHCRFTMHSLDRALAFLAGAKGAVVVKPASGTGGGRGVTTGITTPAGLRAAARLAARFDGNLLVEEQVSGASYRLLYLDGELIDAIRRDPPAVTGDGVRSIRKLIAEENARRLAAPPWRSMNPLVIDRDCRNFLAENGLSLSFVPAQGERVEVKRAVNENGFGENVNVLSDVSVAIAGRCGELVRALGVKLAGVDLYCRDIGGAFEPANCMIGEINTTPAFHHHDLIANPREGQPVGKIVLRHLLQNGIGALATRAPAGTGKPARMPQGRRAGRTSPHAKEKADVS